MNRGRTLSFLCYQKSIKFFQSNNLEKAYVRQTNRIASIRISHRTRARTSMLSDSQRVGVGGCPNANVATHSRRAMLLLPLAVPIRRFMTQSIPAERQHRKCGGTADSISGPCDHGRTLQPPLEVVEQIRH